MKWLPYALAAVLVMLAAYVWNREHRLRVDAERGAEAAQLTLKGQLVQAQGSKDDLANRVVELTNGNSELQAALAEARKAAAGAKVVTASRLDTGALSVKNVPRPGLDSIALHPPSSENRTSECPASVACVLAAGDQLSIQVDVLELRTSAGNTVVVGTAEAFRVDPPPKTSLASGRFQSSLSSAQALGSAPPPRWGVLVIGGCTDAGCGPGIGGISPPFRVPLVGWTAEGFAGVVAAPGAPLILGGLGIRL